MTTPRYFESKYYIVQEIVYNQYKIIKTKKEYKWDKLVTCEEGKMYNGNYFSRLDEYNYFEMLK